MQFYYLITLSVPHSKDVCNFCRLSYASEPFLTAVQHATDEQIQDQNWLQNFHSKEETEQREEGNMMFRYKAWKFLNRPGMTWKKDRML